MRRLVLVLCFLCCGTPVLALPYVDLVVPGTSDPWLAGMPDGSNASINDYAPGQSPVLVGGLDLSIPGEFLRFAASGLVGNGPAIPGVGPDGGGFIDHLTGAENGISNLVCPINSLVGVFLTDDQPDLTPAPAALDFSLGSGLDFPTVAPELKQAFFIGDGQTSGGILQRFYVPTGATRLYLGTMDGYEWNNNHGEFAVRLEGAVDAVPEPGSYVLFGCGILTLGLAFGLRRRR